MEFEIYNFSKFKINKKKLQENLSKISKFLKIDKALIRIFFVNSKEIRKINKKFRNKNRSTTVISLKYQDFKVIDKNLLGEIYLSIDDIKNQNQFFQKTKLADIINYYLIHGLLHLIGYDHSTIKSAKIMENKQAKILEVLNK
jgi:probable rRNA maturation factor